MGQTKTFRQLEKHFKGLANHRRLSILFFVEKNQDEATLQFISDNLQINLKTASGHTHRLVDSGLLYKQYRGREVLHFVSPYGKQLIALVKTFSHS